MGCCPSLPSPITYAVPFGHVPYTPALPGAMGPLYDFEAEWWYYAGWASNSDEMKKFTILVETLRTPIGCSILYGIGSTDVVDSDKQEHLFQTKWIDVKSAGDFPVPTATRWSITVPKPRICCRPSASMSCKLTSGVLGLRDATYKVDMTDSAEHVNVSLNLKDMMGMVLEGASGAYGAELPKKSSYEYAMPFLTIQDGSTITIAGKTTELNRGNIWLDRQCINYADLPKAPKPMYTGNWLAVAMDDQTRYSFAFFWPERHPQWIVGSELKVDPIHKIGLEYPALHSWDKSTPIQGVNVLGETEFDLNILNPHDPSNSPHWTSTTSKHTYCSAWRIKIRDKTYKMTVLIPDCEVKVESCFFEGAATIFDENDSEVGHAFVEMMGYN